MTKRLYAVAISLCLLTAAFAAAQAKPGVLTADEVKKVVPPQYFFRGQSAPVQIRNSGGFRVAPDKLVLAGFVDTSGYAADVQAKYQGLFITEVKLDVGGTRTRSRRVWLSDSPRTASFW